MADSAIDEVYCVCRQPYQNEFMIECDKCKDWFHGSCVGIEEHQSADIESYHCPNCQDVHGPLILKRRRNWHRHDYSELNDGHKAVQSGTVMFIHKLKQMKFPSSEAMMRYPKGAELTPDWFAVNGFNYPLMVESIEGLKLTVPPTHFTIQDVERYVGSMRELDVIDVSRQDDIKMKMREWVEYHNTHPRSKILNVISLEFSDTSLSQLVEAPDVVRNIDWINLYWPANVPEDRPQRPRVQKYCLMGTKDSYTDFHVDFGGTSVWYHIVWGEKVFYLIPPTDENLKKYEKWVMSSNQSEIFFGSQVKECYCITVKQGNTLFIPTGWIHAVLTPHDSLVFGGNFLHSYNIGLQLKIYKLEIRLHTPDRFLHPSYETLCWYAAKNLHKEISGYDGSMPSYLHKGIRSLTDILQQWTSTREAMKEHGWFVPDNITPSSLINQLHKCLQNIECSGDEEEADMKSSTADGSKSIKLKFHHGQITRHEKDGDKEMITIKLSLPQAKKRKEESSDEEDNDLDANEYVNEEGIVDAGAIIDSKDKLWRPSYRDKITTNSNKKTRSLAKLEVSHDDVKEQKKIGVVIPKNKCRTTKQRLGKILGLDRSGRFVKK